MKDISVYRVDPIAGLVYGQRGRPIRKKVNGYIRIWNRSDLTDVSMPVHRVIWEAVNGPVPHGKQINHINGIKIANLELVTPSENLQHAYRLGLARADGEHNGRAIGKRRGKP